MALIDCLKKMGSNPRSPTGVVDIDQKRILAAADQYVSESKMTRQAAEEQAVQDEIDHANAQLEEVQASVEEEWTKSPMYKQQQKAAEVAKETKAKAETTPKPKRVKVVKPEVRTGETTAEAAAREWNTRKPTGFPAFSEIPEKAQKAFAAFGPAGWEQADIISTAAKFSAKRSEGENYLASGKYYYHAVRNDADIASIMKNGLADGTNVSADTKGQAFEDEGGTILVFRRADVAATGKGYQGDLVVRGNPKPVAILKDTSVAEKKGYDDSYAAQVERDYEKNEQRIRNYATTMEISEDEFKTMMVRAEMSRDWSPFGEYADTAKELTKEQNRIYRALEDPRLDYDAKTVTKRDVLAQYEKHGVPVRSVTVEFDEDTDTSKVALRSQAGKVSRDLQDYAQRTELWIENSRDKKADELTGRENILAPDARREYRKGRLTETDVQEIPSEKRREVARDWIKFMNAGDMEGFFNKWSWLRDTMGVKNSIGGHFLEGLHRAEYNSRQEEILGRVARMKEAEAKAVRDAGIARGNKELARNLSADLQAKAEIFAKHLGMSVEAMLAAYKRGDKAALKALYDRVGDIVKTQDAISNFSTAEKISPLGTPVKAMRQALEQFIRAKLHPNKIKLVQTVDEIPPDIIKAVERESGAVTRLTQGFWHAGKVWLIGDHIAPGYVRAVFMHEVGSHMGIEGILTDPQFDKLHTQVLNWAVLPDGNIEGEIARAALARVWGSDTKSAQYNAELIAYTVEEALLRGVNPSANQHTKIGRWFKALWSSFKRVMQKFGINGDLSDLTAQDLVDFAYGAAKLQMSTQGEFVPRGAMRSVAAAMPQSKFDRLPPALQSIAYTTGDLVKRGMLASAFTQDLANYAKKLLPAVTDYMKSLNSRIVDRIAMEAKIDEIYADYQQRLSQGERTLVDKFIHDSTKAGKWGYAILQSREDLVDPGMKARFTQLSPTAQKVVKDVFKHGYESLRQKQMAVMDAAASEYDPLVHEAEKAGDTKKAEKLRKEKAKTLAGFSTLLKLDPHKPYAPLTQFGDHVVVAKSEALIAAEKASEPDSKLIETMKSNADHYFVHFTPTHGQAMMLKAQLDSTGKYADSTTFRKDDEAKFAVWGGTDMLGAINKLRHLLKQTERGSKEENAAVSKAESMLRDMYLQSMAENSARKSELGRLNVAGTSEEMLRAFVKQGRADAHFVASIKHNASLVENLAKMREQAGNDYRKRNYYNEFLSRYANSMNYSPTPVQDAIAQTTSFWFLATSPAYYMQNLTQPLLMSLPYMAAKHGFFRSLNQLTTAYSQISKLDKLISTEQFDLNQLPPDVRTAVQELLNRGRINIGLERELGEIVAGRDNRATAGVNNVVRKFRAATQKVETINRIVTAMAAYRLSGGNIEYADDVIYQTHGDYSGLNAPRIFNVPGSRVILQFKKFQFIQASLLARLLHDSFKGASPEERAVAKKALAYTLGHTAVATGMMGMPFFVPVAWMIGAAFGDDDEPDNPEATLRRYIDNESIADLLLKGAPAAAGVDLSTKLGMGNMLNPFGMTNVSFKDRGAAAETLIAVVGGPTASLTMRAADGFVSIGKGDMYKGMELLMPTGFANAMKGYRFADDGVTTRKGVTQVQPEDVSAFSAAMQAVGLPTTDLTHRTFRSSAAFESTQFYNDKTATLKTQYAKARKEGDTESMAEILVKWQSMQAARVQLGFQRQPLSILMRAPQEIAKQERGVKEGVGYTKQNRKYVEQLTNQ